MKLRRILSALLIAAMLCISAPALAYSMPYYITVDISSQIVTVYRTSDGGVARQMLCSTGKRGNTPIGVFTLPKNRRAAERSKWMYLSPYACYVKYATRITGSILFHSLPYDQTKDSTLQLNTVKTFGTPSSHGCVRLLDDDAKFIAENCLAGTKVKIFKSGDAQEDLRELLYQSSYTGEGGVSYDDFMGIPDDPTTMGRFSTGQEVSDLQHRLRALGFYADEITGEYRTSTINAVKQVQAALNLEQNGQTTEELKALLFSSGAPTAMNVALQEGSSGPAVRNLQTNLAALKLYEGDVDGVYDVEVMEAVRVFQRAYGYEVDGMASSELQKAVLYETGRLAELYGEDAAYRCEVATDTISMVRVRATTGIRVRSEPNTKSEALARVTDGVSLALLEAQDGWSKVSSGGNVGYIKNDYLEPFTQETAYLRYTCAGNDQVYTIGRTREEDLVNAAFPAEVFAEYLASGGALDDYGGIVDYATVNTRQEGLKLNLRESDSKDSNVLAELENGTELRVLLRNAEWALVVWEEQSGYLLGEYLDFWTGPADYLDAAESADASEADVEQFASAQGLAGVAVVYDMDSDDAEELGALPNGTVLKIVRADDDWSLVELDGNQGYMHTDDLEFIVSDAE